MMRRASVAVACAIGAAGAAHAQPVNDTCETAIPIAAGASVAGTTVGAAGDGASSCEFFGSSPDVYYQFTATEGGLYTFDTIGSPSIGNLIAVYAGCPVEFTVVCDMGSDPSGHAVVMKPVSAGQTVYVAVAHVDGTGQPFTLNVSGPLPPPSNDECTAAIPLALDVPFSGDNIGATTSMLFDSSADCNSTQAIFSVGADDVFFTFTPDASGAYDFSTCGSGIDTVLSVHAGCPATPANAIACFDNSPAGGGACPTAFLGSSYLPGLLLDAGVTYTIRVAGLADRDFDFSTNTIHGGRQGSFEVVVTTGTPAAIPPVNDDCASAALLSLGVTTGTNLYATGEQAGPCTPVGRDSGDADLFDVWYAFTAPATSVYAFAATAEPIEQTNNLTLALFTSCDGELLSCLATQAGEFGLPRRLAAALIQGQTVLLRVSAVQGLQAAHSIEVTDAGPAPANRTCAAAQVVAVGSITPVDLSAAPSSEAQNCGSGSFDVNALWYRFTTVEAGMYRIAADSTLEDVDTELLILNGCGGEVLACASEGDELSFSALAAAATLHLEAGQSVAIRAASNLGRADVFELEVSHPLPPPPPPSNDDCANATVVEIPFADGFELGGAGNDLDTACNDPALTESVAGAWYTLSPAEDCLLSITRFSSANLAVTAFTGQCGSLVEIGCVSPTLTDPTTGTIPVQAGETYYFLVHVADDTPPGFAFAEVFFDCLAIPANDACAGAEVIDTPGTNLIADITSALEDGEASCTGANPTIFSSLWYTFRTDSAGELTVHNDLSLGIVINSVMALYEGQCGSLVEVACVNNESGSHFPLVMYDLAATLDADTTYYLAVGARSRPESMINDLTFNYTGTFAPACEGDLDRDGDIDVFDLLSYLDAWFAGDAAAERTGDDPAVIDVFDLLAYLDVWFAGCP